MLFSPIRFVWRDGRSFAILGHLTIEIGQSGLVFFFVAAFFEYTFVPDETAGLASAQIVLDIFELLSIVSELTLEQLDGVPDVAILTLHMHNDFKG